MTEPHWGISLLVSLVPLVLFALVMGWHARQVRQALETSTGRPMADVLEELAAELKRVRDQGNPSVPMLR